MLRAAELIFQKTFNGAAWQEERFGKDSNKEVLTGYDIIAFNGISKNGDVKSTTCISIAGKVAALACYCRLGFAYYFCWRS